VSAGEAGNVSINYLHINYVIINVLESRRETHLPQLGAGGWPSWPGRTASAGLEGYANRSRIGAARFNRANQQVGYQLLENRDRRAVKPANETVSSGLIALSYQRNSRASVVRPLTAALAVHLGSRRAIFHSRVISPMRIHTIFIAQSFGQVMWSELGGLPGRP
jgi:hypothetical protein